MGSIVSISMSQVITESYQAKIKKTRTTSNDKSDIPCSFLFNCCGCHESWFKPVKSERKML